MTRSRPRTVERLGPDDAAILGLESEVIAGHTLKVIVIAPGPESLTAAAIRARVSERLAYVPRARQRVVATPLRLATPAWVDDSGFDPAHHVVEAAGGEALDEAGLKRLAGGLMADRLAHDRPLWRIDVAPLEHGGTALIARVHHCMADGITTLRLLGALLWDEQPPGEPADGFPRPAPSPARLVLSALGSRAADLGGVLAGTVKVLPRPALWGEQLRELAAMPAALRRELAGSAGPTPFDRTLGGGRCVSWVEAELAELKRIEHAAGAGVTVNDVLLAAVGGGIRRWMRDNGATPDLLRFKVPVSMHARDEGADQLGNRDSFMFIDLPAEVDDPMERLRAVAAETSERKSAGDPAELYRFFHAVSHIRPLGSRVSRRAMAPGTFSLSISNVPGPREPVSVLGRGVEAMHTMAEPADRHVLRVAAVSLAGRLSVGLCADPDAIGDLDRLAGEVAKEIAALSASACAEPQVPGSKP